MDARLAVALLAGRAAASASRGLGRGGGTVLPGHVVARIDPTALSKLARQLERGVVLVSGTNGKTTTSRMIAHIATLAGDRPIHNRSGANLMTGIVSAISARASLAGQPAGDVAVFEVDEANLPAAVQATRPRVLALLNLFRDQLDRYGEVDTVAKTWRAAIQSLDRDAILVLNGDDPIVASLAEAAQGRVLTFGVTTQSVGGPTLAHEADRRLCPRCAERLRYTWTYYGHVGHYVCQHCGWERPRPLVALTDVALHGGAPTELAIDVQGTVLETLLPLPGLYNAYNALAATTVCHALGTPLRCIAEGLETFSAVFGRQEQIAVGRGSISLALVKNPVGFNQVLATAAEEQPPDQLVIAINDLFADGTDISWLWDVDFERLASMPGPVLCTGLRAADMALRLKYAELPGERVAVQPDLEKAVEGAVALAMEGQHVMIFPTYTAMLSIRDDLQRRGLVPPFWED
jgi:lipid II isoglutaminyl synthase (glutamine-hydrolysing)